MDLDSIESWHKGGTELRRTRKRLRCRFRGGRYLLHQWGHRRWRLVGFGLVGLIPVVGGATNSLRDVSKAITDVSVEITKDVSKEIGQQVAVQIAKEGLEGAAKESVIEGGKFAVQIFAKEAIKESTRGIVQETAKDLALEATKNMGNELLQQTTKDLLKEGAKNTAGSTVVEGISLLCEVVSALH